MAHEARTRAGQVILITGASSGIGLECASHLARLGHRVYGTSRSGRPRDGAAPPPFEMVRLDVTSDTDTAAAVDHVVGEAGRIDVLVNNAGFGIAGSVEETSIDEARAQFETNLFGPMRLTAMVLPHMRRRRAGLVVNVSSIAGLVPVPFQGLYSASKAALESVTEALRMEVRPFGVRVALLEPGDFHTAFTANRVRIAAATPQSPYRESFERANAVFERDESSAPPPIAVARELERIVDGRSTRFRHPVGALLQRAAPNIRHLLPNALYERLMMQTYDIHR